MNKSKKKKNRKENISILNFVIEYFYKNVFNIHYNVQSVSQSEAGVQLTSFSITYFN